MWTYLNNEYYSRWQRWTTVHIFERGGWTLAYLNMIDRESISSGIVSLDAFFCNNTMGTVKVCKPYSFGWAHPKLYGSHTFTVPIVLALIGNYTIRTVRRFALLFIDWTKPFVMNYGSDACFVPWWLGGVYKCIDQVYEYYSWLEEVVFQNLSTVKSSHHHPFLNTANSDCVLLSHCLMWL